MKNQLKPILALSGMFTSSLFLVGCQTVDTSPPDQAPPAQSVDEVTDKADKKAVEAGPIWNNSDAQMKCSKLAAEQGGKWTGGWWTTVQGKMSVCEISFASKTTASETEEALLVIDQSAKPKVWPPQNIQYSKDAASKGIEGTVFITLVVTPTGEVRDPEVLRGVHPELDAEALRAISELEFEPGMHEGRYVNHRLNLPVKFKLNRPVSAE